MFLENLRECDSVYDSSPNTFYPQQVHQKICNSNKSLIVNFKPKMSLRLHVTNIPGTVLHLGLDSNPSTSHPHNNFYLFIYSFILFFFLAITHSYTWVERINVDFLHKETAEHDTEITWALIYRTSHLFILTTTPPRHHQ